MKSYTYKEVLISDKDIYTDGMLDLGILEISQDETNTLKIKDTLKSLEGVEMVQMFFDDLQYTIENNPLLINTLKDYGDVLLFNCTRSNTCVDMSNKKYNTKGSK